MLGFGSAVILSAVGMMRGREWRPGSSPAPDVWADRLRLHGSYHDGAIGQEIAYRVYGTRWGLLLMYVAGTVSGLLGIGAGALKVPAMDLAMRLPIKVSSATSNLMIGVTAAASAGVYFARGNIDPLVTAPVACGVVLGALSGSRLLPRLRSKALRLIFVALLLWIGLQMIAKAIR
jgi:uncharacterized membrane protein YfcA